MRNSTRDIKYVGFGPASILLPEANLQLLATETAFALSFRFSINIKPQNYVFRIGTKAQTSPHLDSFHTLALFIRT